MEENPNDPVLLIREAAKYLGMSTGHLSRLARAGKISFSRTPGLRSQYRFRLSLLNEWLEKNGARA